MIIIPAVDIRGGRCVRLFQGREDRETVYSDDPLQMAIKWESLGARRIHLVDLDGAISASDNNTEKILEIAEKIKVELDLGGGIRTMEKIELFLENGVDRVILGTAVLEDRDLLIDALKTYPGRITAGLDTVDRKLSIRGWKKNTSKDIEALLEELSDTGLDELIITDISTDGTLAGTNFEYFQELTKKTSIDIIASGGISTIEDIKRLSTISDPALKGAIVGKALYDNKLDLKEALQYEED